MIRFTVEPGEGGRVDLVLQQRYPNTTRKLLAGHFADRQVLVDGAVAKKGTRVGPGSIIELRSPPPEPDALRAVPEADAPLSVLHEDAALIAIDKPAPMPSHPLRLGETGTAANAIVARYPECAGVGDDPRESGLVHRLDTETTGVLVAARTRAAWDVLRDDFTAGRVRKQYLALVAAAITDGSSDEPIGNLEARTAWTVARTDGAHTLLRVTPNTGRMHQIRIHLAQAGAPILGDTRYAGPVAPAGTAGHCLHAHRLELTHPSTGEPLALEAPPPAWAR
jgi:23S rRNA pseudouridine1911/1915/1917 synthase